MPKNFIKKENDTTRLGSGNNRMITEAQAYPMSGAVDGNIWGVTKLDSPKAALLKTLSTDLSPIADNAVNVLGAESIKRDKAEGTLAGTQGADFDEGRSNFFRETYFTAKSQADALKLETALNTTITNFSNDPQGFRKVDAEAFDKIKQELYTPFIEGQTDATYISNMAGVLKKADAQLNEFYTKAQHAFLLEDTFENYSTVLAASLGKAPVLETKALTDKAVKAYESIGGDGKDLRNWMLGTVGNHYAAKGDVASLKAYFNATDDAGVSPMTSSNRAECERFLTMATNVQKAKAAEAEAKATRYFNIGLRNLEATGDAGVNMESYISQVTDPVIRTEMQAQYKAAKSTANAVRAYALADAATLKAELAALQADAPVAGGLGGASRAAGQEARQRALLQTLKRIDNDPGAEARRRFPKDWDKQQQFVTEMGYSVGHTLPNTHLDALANYVNHKLTPANSVAWNAAMSHKYGRLWPSILNTLVAEDKIKPGFAGVSAVAYAPTRVQNIMTNALVATPKEVNANLSTYGHKPADFSIQAVPQAAKLFNAYVASYNGVRNQQQTINGVSNAITALAKEYVITGDYAEPADAIKAATQDVLGNNFYFAPAWRGNQRIPLYTGGGMHVDPQAETTKQDQTTTRLHADVTRGKRKIAIQGHGYVQGAEASEALKQSKWITRADGETAILTCQGLAVLVDGAPLILTYGDSDSPIAPLPLPRRSLK